MNTVSYFLLNKMSDIQGLDPDYQECLYQFYEYGSNKLNFNIEIAKEDFQELFNIIYSVLRLRIDDNDFKRVSEHYLELLMADARDGDKVDINWFINHIWYLCVGISKEIETRKYRDCIPFIQQSLIKKFNIGESIKEKVSRKIYTRYMAQY